MDPDRWRKIERIFDKVLDADKDLRDRVLRESCAGDESLRREVESLLAQHTLAGEFIETPAFAVSQSSPGGCNAPNSIAIAANTVVGHYRILGKIGSGGMGVVYQAEDLKLGRHVALKFLDEQFAQDPDSLRRFSLEARAASALNHANICTIYEIDEVEGRAFIAMELLEGQMLKQFISSKPLAVDAVVNMGIQIANGLDAAHAKGIVHRDIKPANIFVVKHRRIKILDFGIAKLMRRDATSLGPEETQATQTGFMMGTVGYMSPEQVRGQAVDHRTDIFAVGTILYEMLTGRRAFERATSADTISAILHEDPPDLAQSVPGAPLSLLRVVQRCLEKEPERRFQSASDLAFALEALPGNPAVSSARPPRSGWVKPVGIAAALVALAALLVAWWRLPPAFPTVVSVKQITDDGEPKQGKLVTDGARIYVNEGEIGSYTIAQVSIAGGATAAVNSGLANPQIAGITADGSAMLASVGGQGDAAFPLWSIPLPAGEPRRLGSVAGQDASLFPDGRLLVAKGRDILVADNDGSNARTILSMPGIVILENPSVSADGKRIAFTSYTRGWSSSALIAGGSDGSGLRTLLDTVSRSQPCCGSWSSDGKYLVYEATRPGGSDLWALPLESGFFHRGSVPIRLTAGPLSYSGALPSRNGNQIFAIGTKRRGELVRYDRPTHQFLPFLSGLSAIDPTFSSDGKWMAYTSYPDHTLWRARSDGTGRTQLTYPPMEVSAPSLSRDGTHVAFRTMDWDVYVISANGGPMQMIAKHSDGPIWSPDGNLLLLTSYTDAPIGEDTRVYLQVFDFRTGKLSVVPSSQGLGGGHWSSQETILAAPYNPTKFLTFNFRTQKWTDLIAGAVVNWTVSLDGKYLYFTTAGAEPTAKRLRFADRMIEPLADLNSLRRVVDPLSATQIDIAPDGSAIFARDIGTQEVYALNLHWAR